MIPLSNVVQTEFGSGAQVISHFNTKRAVEINGLETMGYSSGDVLLALQELAKTELPSGYTYEFAGASLQEVRSGNTATLILLLSLVFVFLFLAALYESWTVPFAVLAAIPIGILGAFIALYFAGFENSVYAQIALVTLIGLSAKTSILIVEFCKDKYEAGTPLLEAAMQASVQRLRPILMTGLAFILGVVALMRANGAGYAPKNNLGWAVFGGMMAIVFVSIFFVPALYVFIVKMTTKNGRTKNVDGGF
jgi:multidrug efflux pump subunit AcrB